VNIAVNIVNIEKARQPLPNPPPKGERKSPTPAPSPEGRGGAIRKRPRNEE